MSGAGFQVKPLLDKTFELPPGAATQWGHPDKETTDEGRGLSSTLDEVAERR